MPSTLCQRCRVLEFDDTSLGGHKVGSVKRGFHLELQHPKVSNKVHLDYHLKDELPELSVLTESASEGCEFCRLLKASLKEHTPPTARQVEVHLWYQWNPKSQKSGAETGLAHLKAQIKLNGPDIDSHFIYLHFYIDGPQGQSTQWLRLEQSPRTEALCEENISWISQRLSDTAYNHRPASSIANFPNRLVYIGDTESSICRLVYTRSDPDFTGDPQKLKYVALSYCWGSSEDAALQTTSTKASLQMREAGFHADTLSPVLQDAIKVCRACKIGYVWVDALCIIQDDHIDWQKESARMFLIYQHAYFTLCATSSNSCQQGFLERKRPTAMIPFQSKVDENIHGSYTLRSPAIQQSGTSIGAFSPWRIDLMKSTWSSRAWTFQELRMSSRVLAFGSYTIHFLTADCVYSETADNSLILKSDNRADLVDVETAFDTFSGIYTTMLRQSLIEIYARKKLTNPLDRLPAFGGIASLAFQDDPGQYVAGLSKQDLHIDLFWCYEFRIITALGRPGKPVTRKEFIESFESREDYVAPSWSWASAKRNVMYEQGGFRLDTVWTNIRKEYTEANVSVEYEGKTPFGRVKDGSLELTATVLSIPPDLQPPKDIYSRIQSGEGVSHHQAKEGRHTVARINFDWDILQPEDCTQEALKNMFLVLIGSCTDYDLSSSSDFSTTDDEDTKIPSILTETGSASILNDKQDPDETNTTYPKDHTLGRGGTEDHTGNEDEKSRSHETELSLEPLKIEDGISKETCDHGEELELISHIEDHDDVAIVEGLSLPSDEADVWGDFLGNDSGRYAYGLVVHKSQKLNAYIRVGIFHSEPPEFNSGSKKGGLRYFRAGSRQTIKIV